MKTKLVTVIFLAATLGAFAPSCLAADSPKSPLAFPVRVAIASPEGGESIERGKSRSFVAWAMRNRSRTELSPDQWVFKGYQADLQLANDRECEFLVITFDHDQVVDLLLVTRSAIGVLTARINTKSSTREIAVEKHHEIKQAHP